MICESFSLLSRAWPGSYNVVLNYVLCLITLLVPLHRASLNADFEWPLEQRACFTLLLLCGIACYETARRIDPGVLKRQSSHAALRTPNTMWCEVCDVPCLERSKHCNICNVHTMRFDHHCAWLNCCVARRNLAPFLGMLVFYDAFLWWGVHVVWTSWDGSDAGVGDVLEVGGVLLVQLLCGVAALLLLLSCLSRISANLTTFEIIRPPAYLAAPGTSNKFDLGFSENWSAFWDAWAHEATFYRPLDRETEAAAASTVSV